MQERDEEGGDRLDLVLQVPLPRMVREQHTCEEGTDDSGESDELRESSHEETDDDREHELVHRVGNLSGGDGLLTPVVEVIVDLRDHELACQDDDSDEEDGLDGDGQDVDDGDTGLRHSLDDGEYDHSEDIVDDGRTDDDTGLTGVHELHILDDTRGDTY